MMHRFRVGLAAILLIACASGTARAAADKFGALLRRIPEQSNMLLLVDVDGLLDSPLGQREKWREGAVAKARNTLGMPPTMSRAAVAIGLEFHDLQIGWRLGLAEYRDRLPDLATLAAREGGFVEKIDLATVAWTPRDLYFIAIEPKILGFLTPAGRQGMAKWVRGTFVRPRDFPPGFADRAIHRAEAGSAVVLAVNLTDTVSAPLIKPWVASLDGMSSHLYDAEMMAERLASVKLAFLQVDVKESIEGTLRVEFDRELEYVRPIAKEAVLAALDVAGLALEDMKTWRGGADGRSIELKGPLSEASLRRILSLAAMPQTAPELPSLAPIAPGQEVADSPVREASRDDIATASRAYYRSVVDILDGVKGQKGGSYNGVKTWYERAARQIDELPILGLDKEVLDWGSVVSRTLREMASGINYNFQDRKYSRSTSGGYYNGYGYGVSSNAPQEAIRQQGEATLSVSMDGRWQALNTSVGDMRRKMVEKYAIDF